MADKEVTVREHRRRLGKMRADSTAGKSLELPLVAPQTGVKIIDTHAEREQPTRAERGVKRVGGGDHGKIDKGVKRVHR
jgi:hypothetical protein